MIYLGSLTLRDWNISMQNLKVSAHLLGWAVFHTFLQGNLTGTILTAMLWTSWAAFSEAFWILWDLLLLCESKPAFPREPKAGRCINRSVYVLLDFTQLAQSFSLLGILWSNVSLIRSCFYHIIYRGLLFRHTRRYHQAQLRTSAQKSKPVCLTLEDHSVLWNPRTIIVIFLIVTGHWFCETPKHTTYGFRRHLHSTK